VSSAARASTSSTSMVNTAREPAPGPAALAGAMSSSASVIFSRLISVPPNLVLRRFW
jgi:hypothetical protein